MFRDLLIKTITSSSLTLSAPASFAADEKHMLVGLDRFIAELIDKARGWTTSRWALVVQIPSCHGFKTSMGANGNHQHRKVQLAQDPI